MMRPLRQVDALSALKNLSQYGISFHIQIVCVPGYNDGEALKQTLKDLHQTKLNCLSIGIVPVGLTKYRQNLFDLKTFNQHNAIEVLDLIEEARNLYSSDIIYPADEFFVLAGRNIPDEDYYADYPQLENGIGMLRLTIQNYKLKKRSILKELRKKPVDYLMISSVCAKEVISKIAEDLNKRLENQRIRVQVINNDFFGPDINVCGLITYSDLYSQLSPEKNETLILPSCIFNTEGETLDGKDRITFQETWNNPILLIDQFFEEWDYL
jgi:NifB/MoaA-like Fe-S oxidoreductase